MRANELVESLLDKRLPYNMSDDPMPGLRGIDRNDAGRITIRQALTKLPAYKRGMILADIAKYCINHGDRSTFNDVAGMLYNLGIAIQWPDRFPGRR